ncbi:MAG: EAL domain-containing protein [Acholeplasmatales bacterium]|nr:EAL domain-containing protein [Acholeplasmatales bacterium]
MKNNIINKLKRYILIVEDEYINQEILKEILSNEYEILVANNGVEALQILNTSTKPISLILLDLNMPIMDGFTVLKEIKKDENKMNIPVIVITGDKGSELEALTLGAVDFITKPFDLNEIIMARVNRSIELSEKRIIVSASERDELTNVYSKHVFEKYVERINKYKQNEKTDMIVLNISRFHLYNELYGKEEGDKALVYLANILKEIANNNDGIVARLQRDYFALYINHLDNYDNLADKINNELKNNYNITNINIRFGIYSINNTEINIDNCIDRATLVCDEISNSNTKIYNVYNEDDQKKQLFKERLNHDFKNAIDNKEFKVFYQPKISISNGKYVLSSAEALVRWIHPELGFISPGMFIPLFEENGNIKILDQYVWNEAAHQIKEWKDKFNIVLPVSVNVSRADMFDEKVVDVINNIVIENKIKPEYLYLEITESAYNNETDQIVEIINKLRNLGFKIEIDDFGSGYSSLNTLATLSFDYLKLDMKFVHDMFTNDKTLKMVGIVSDIAKYLNVKLIAEGVETKEQLEKLKELKYDVIQGYYFSKPVANNEFEEFFRKEFN